MCMLCVLIVDGLLTVTCTNKRECPTIHFQCVFLLTADIRQHSIVLVLVVVCRVCCLGHDSFLHMQLLLLHYDSCF